MRDTPTGFTPIALERYGQRDPVNGLEDSEIGIGVVHGTAAPASGRLEAQAGTHPHLLGVGRIAQPDEDHVV